MVWISSAGSSNGRLPSWESLWITLWTRPAAISVQSQWGSPATSGRPSRFLFFFLTHPLAFCASTKQLPSYASSEPRMRMTAEGLLEFRTLRRSVPPPSPPPLPLRWAHTPLSLCLSILTLDYHFTLFSRPFSLTFVVHVDSVCLHSESVPFQTVQAPPAGQSPAPIGSRTCHSQCESLVVFDGVLLCEKRCSSPARLHLSSFVFITTFSISWPLESLQLASSRVCIPVACLLWFVVTCSNVVNS